MPKVLVCDGDSITSGLGITTPYPSSLGLIGSWTTHNVAVSGETLATMLANAPTVVDALFSGAGDVVTILGGINDLAGGTTPAALINILWAYCDARRAVGWKVVVMTMISAHPTLDALRDTYNALIYADWQAHADALADMAANPFVGIDGSYADTTYFQSDGVHPTQLSATSILAPITSEQINNIVLSFRSTVLALDIFRRADETRLSAPWLAPTGGAGLNLTSTLAQGTQAGDSEDYYSTLTPPADQYAEVVIGNAPGAGLYIGPAVRMQAGTDSFYGLFVQPATKQATIFKWSSGSGSTIGSVIAVASVGFGDRFRLVARGSTLTSYQNGVLLDTVIDTDFATGKAGIIGYGSGAAASEWSAGSLLSTISGNAGIAGATVTLSGTASAVATADGTGAYFFTGLAAGSYTITPTKTGNTFSPSSANETVTTADITGVNFTAAAGFPTSIRERILSALKVTYGLATATFPNGVIVNRPAGLTVHRERTRPIETDQLPAIMFYADDEQPKPLGAQIYNAPLTERQLSISIECRAQGSNTVSPDAALDPILVWALQALQANEKFGGLANGVEEGRTVWNSREGDVPVAAATIHVTIKYRTSRLDPTSTS